jgi:tRNA A-37 threonylcarbamoyl transferase component Bud32/predicted esterase
MDVPSVLRTALADRYRVEEVVGSGGMAIVYRCRDLKHDRTVALKVLRPEVAASIGAERFLREIQISARLNHPHILTLIDSGAADGFLYFVLPYVEGESVRERIDREGRLPIEEALRITDQVASALGYAHAEGVIHRDIKPGNILIHRGEAEVSDFGIAVGIAAAADERLTSTGLAVGSPGYMSPEQIDETGSVDDRSDLYSLACLAYEMLTGTAPFTASSAQASLVKALTGSPTRLEELRPEVPPAVAQVIHRAMARDPAERFESVASFATALHTAAAGAAAPASRALPRWQRIAFGAATAAALLLITWLVVRPDSGRLAREAVLRTEQALAEADMLGAYLHAMALPDGIEDSVAASLLDAASVLAPLRTDPGGATVSWRPLLRPDDEWQTLGTTPLTARIPRTQVLFRFERDGYRPRLLWTLPALDTIWSLRPEDGELPGALFVPGGRVNPGVLAGGIWQGDARLVSDYLIDATEVTNREFKEFVDAGGYARPEFWNDPVVGDGRSMTWQQAVATFLDRTGRPGPATWEIGTFPDGMGDHPVTGVSWYEAAAYAQFRGRQLPTIYHWYWAAWVQQAQNVVPLSNLNGQSLAPVGRFQGVTVIGASDMAGNAREWVANAAGEYRLTQGGSWADANFAFPLAQQLSPLDRSELNGLRLITDLGDPGVLATASAPVAYFERDFAAQTPVSNEVFEVYRDLYAYDDTPLDAVVETTDTVSPGIVRERILLDAAYGGERLVVYLFRPVADNGRPLETVVYFPGSGYFNYGRFDIGAEPQTRVGLIVRSGRALAFPVIDGTFERADDFVYTLQDETNAYRDRVIAWYRDMGRTLDYIETRPDLDSERVAYFGHSLGGRMGAIMLALEPRFRTAVLYVAGLSPKPTQPVVDPFNFLPRVRAPVRVISGQFDPIYPLEISARPFFERLGSEVKDHYIAEGAHFVPWPRLAQQTLEWLDVHLSAQD